MTGSVNGIVTDFMPKKSPAVYGRAFAQAAAVEFKFNTEVVVFFSHLGFYGGES